MEMKNDEDENKQIQIQRIIQLERSQDTNYAKYEFEDIQKKCHQIHEYVPHIIITLMRRNKISYNNIERIIDYLLQNDKFDDLIFINQLCRIVKYSVYHGYNCKLQTLIDLLKFDQQNTNSEIVNAIGFYIDQSKQQLDPIQVKNIEEKLKENVSEEARTNILLKIKKSLPQKQKKDQEFLNLQDQKPKQTQYLQKVRIQQETIQEIRGTQQMNLVILGEDNLFQSMNKNYQSTLHQLPNKVIDISKKGNDTTWTKGTYNNVINLYNIVESQQIICDDDKDQYLPSIFLQFSQKSIFNGIFDILVTDRMIADIFQKISIKQKLNNYCIQQLTYALDTLPNICQLILKDFYLINFHKKIIGSFFSTKMYISQTPNKIESDLYQKIQKIYKKRGYNFLKRKINLQNDSEENEINQVLLQMIKDEVNLIRLDSATALYHCFLVNFQSLKSNNLLIEKIKQCLIDDNKEFVDKITLITETFLNNVSDVKKLFSIHFQNIITDPINNPISMEFIFKQSMIASDGNLLFNDLDVNKILKLIYKTQEIKVKVNCQQMINNIILQPKNNGLSPYQLQLCQQIIIKDELLDEDFIVLVLISIYLTTKKQINFPQEVITFLFSKLDTFKEIFKYYTIMILGSFYNQYQNKKNVKYSNIYILIPYIRVQIIVVDNGSQLMFKEQIENKDCLSISQIVLKILLYKMKKQFILKELIINDILSVIEKKDTQAKILASQLIFENIDQSIRNFNEFHLNQIKQFISDDIYDVHIYMLLSYTKCIKNMLEQSMQVSECQINSMSQFFSFYEYFLNSTEYSVQVNTCILEGLFLYAKQNGKFDQITENLLESILLGYSSGEYFKRVQEIISIYSFNNNISKKLQQSLELLFLQDKGDSQQLYQILDNVMLNRLPISTNIQSKYIEDFLSQNERIQNSQQKKFISRLNLTEFQQGLSDENFEQLELQKQLVTLQRNNKIDIFKIILYLLFLFIILLQNFEYALQLRKNNFFLNNILEIIFQSVSLKLMILLLIVLSINYKLSQYYKKQQNEINQHIFNNLLIKTNEGLKMPQNIFQILDKFSYHDQVKKIIFGIIKNKQNIPQYLIDSLVERFNSQIDEDYYVSIFYLLFKNNQNISSFVDVLEIIVKTKSNLEKKLQIIHHLAEKGERLSLAVLQNLIDYFYDEKDQIIQQKIAQVIFLVSSNINRNVQIQFINKIKNIFFLYINLANLTRISREFFIGLNFLQNNNLIDENLVSELFKLVVNIEISINIRGQILTILEKQQLSEEQSQIISTLSHSKLSDDVQLYQISMYSKNQRLTSYHFKTLQEFLERDLNQDNEGNLQIKSLQILINIDNTDIIPQEVVDSITSLLSRTQNELIIQLCCKLIEQISKDRILNENILNILLCLRNNEKVNSTIKKIQLKQPLPIDQSVIFQIENLPFMINENTLSKVLEDLIFYLKSGFYANENIPKKIIQILENQYKILPLSIFQRFADVFSLLLEQDKINFIKYHEMVHYAIILSIQQSQISRNIVCGFRKLIRFLPNRFSFSDFIQEIFTYEKYYSQDYTINYLLLKIILAIIEEKQVLQIPQECIKILKNNIEDDNQLIHHISQKILKKIKQNNSYYFLNYFYSHHSFQSYHNTQSLFNLALQNQQNIILLQKQLLNNLNLEGDQQNIFLQAWKNGIKMLDEEQIVELLENLIECQIDYELNIQQINYMILVIEYFCFANYIEYLKKSNPFNQIFKQYMMKKLKEPLINNKVEDNQIISIINKIYSSFDLDFIYHFLERIQRIQDLNELRCFVDFMEQNKVNSSHLCKSKKSINQLKLSIQIKLMKINIKMFIKKKKVKKFICILLGKNWSCLQLNQIISLLVPIDFINPEKHLVYHFLNMIINFDIQPSQAEDLSKSLSFQNADSVIYSFNKFCFKNKFYDVNENIDIIKELSSINLGSQFNYNELHDIINRIKNLQFGIDPSNYSEKKIQQWSQKIRKDQSFLDSETFSFQCIQMVKRAYFLLFNNQMKDSQILSCLMILRRNKDKGRIMQVETGEGKSLIICTLAIIYAIQRHKVNILTSSPVLAERDAKKYSQLFKMFNINCSSNKYDNSVIKGVKQCYLSDVVFGDISQYQFDALEDEFNQKNSLGGRKYEIVIIDEADMMFLDETSKTARLSSQIPGMDLLYLIYYQIWNSLNVLLKSVVSDSEYSYFLKGNLENKEGKIIFKYYENSMPKQIDDFIQFLSQKQNLDKIYKFSEQVHKNKFQSKLIEIMKEQISNEIENEKIKIPNNLKCFVKRQIAKWVENAIVAYQFQENVNYIISDGQIKPVDYFSTGQVLNQTNWGDGLHQFLQIKHNLKLTPETLTTNFLSNTGYIKRYQNIIGFTGTLGSEKAKEVMAKIYNVDFIYIPRLNAKKYIQYQPLIEQSEDDWIESICDSSLVERLKQRGVLIICESIQYATLIKQQLNKKIDQGNIRLYTINNSMQELQIEKIYKGQIFVATNLAGRGTDINASEIEENGGLHVIVTFIPQNQRVQQQAFGRTARLGNQGTGQLIINVKSKEVYHSNENGNKYLDDRDKIECDELDGFVHNQLNYMNIKDKFFSQFCQHLKQIRQNIKQNVKKQKNILRKQINSQQFEEYQFISAIQEIWAFFLHQIERVDEINFKKQFDEFIEQLKEYENLIINPFYYVQIANQFMLEDNYNQSEIYYDKAIQLKYNYGAAEYVGKAIVQIKQKKENYKKEALDNFKTALLNLREEQRQLVHMYESLQNLEIQSDLIKQLIIKLQLLSTYINSIESSKEQIICSLRYIEIECSNDKEKIKKYFHQKDQSFIIDAQNTDRICITFNDLTNYYDCGNVDQAIKTINNSSNQIKQLEKIVQLNLKQISSTQLVQILIDKKEINQCSKEQTFENKYEDNKIHQIIKEQNVEINLQVLDFQKSDEFKKFFQLISSKIQMKLEGSIGQIKKALDISKSKIIKVISQDKVEEISIESFSLKYIRINNELIATIELFSNEKEFCEQILKECEFRNIDIQFQNVDISQKIDLPEATMNANFKLLDKKYSIKLITLLRKEQIKFSLTFNSLNKQLANQIIQNACMEQEDLKVTCLKTIDQQFSEMQSTAHQELSELKNRGIEIFCQINERGFFQMTSFGLIALFSFVQISIGVGLGFSSKYGLQINKDVYFKKIGVAYEGFIDAYNAYTILRDKQFQWKSYGIQKAVNSVVSLITLNIGVASKVTSQSTQTSIKAGNQVFIEAAEQKTSNLICRSQKILEFVKKIFSKESRKVLIKQSLRIGASKALSYGIDKLIQQAIKFIEPYIYQKIEKEISELFYSSRLKNQICKMQAIDKVNHNQELKQKINILISNTLNQGFTKQIMQNCFPLVKLIAQNLASNQFQRKIGLSCALVYNVIGILECSGIVNRFYNEMMKSFSEIDKYQLSIYHLLNRNCKIDYSSKQKFKQLCEILIENNFIIRIDDKASINSEQYYLEYINPLAFGKEEYLFFENNSILKKFPMIELKKDKEGKMIQLDQLLSDLNFKADLKQVHQFLYNLNKEMNSIQLDEVQHFIQSVTIKITNLYINNILNFFISPYSNLVIDEALNYVNKNYLENFENKLFNDEKEQSQITFENDPNVEENLQKQDQIYFDQQTSNQDTQMEQNINNEIKIINVTPDIPKQDEQNNIRLNQEDFANYEKEQDIINQNQESFTKYQKGYDFIKYLSTKPYMQKIKRVINYIPDLLKHEQSKLPLNQEDIITHYQEEENKANYSTTKSKLLTIDYGIFLDKSIYLIPFFFDDNNSSSENNKKILHKYDQQIEPNKTPSLLIDKKPKDIQYIVESKQDLKQQFLIPDRNQNKIFSLDVKIQIEKPDIERINKLRLNDQTKVLSNIISFKCQISQQQTRLKSDIKQEQSIQEELMQLMAEIYFINYRIVYDTNYQVTENDKYKFRFEKQYLIYSDKNIRQLHLKDPIYNEHIEKYNILYPLIQDPTSIVSNGFEIMFQIIKHENENETIKIVKEKIFLSILLKNEHILEGYYSQNESILNKVEELNNNFYEKGEQQVKKQCIKTIQKARNLLKYGTANNEEHKQRNNLTDLKYKNLPQNEKDKIMKEEHERQDLSKKFLSIQRQIIDFFFELETNKEDCKYLYNKFKKYIFHYTDQTKLISQFTKFQSGNCGEFAQLVLTILKYQCPQNVIIETRQEISKQNDDIIHSFIAIKPKNVIDDTQTLIIDAWPSDQILDPQIIPPQDHFSYKQNLIQRVNYCDGIQIPQGDGKSWDDIYLLEPPYLQIQPQVDQRLIELIFCLIEKTYIIDHQDSVFQRIQPLDRFDPPSFHQ